MVSRDFLTVKIWDVCKTDKPVNVITLQDSMKSKLCEIFENECMEDKFTLGCSKNCDTIFTGSFNNSFHLLSMSENNRRRSFELPEVFKEKGNGNGNMNGNTNGNMNEY